MKNVYVMYRVEKPYLTKIGEASNKRKALKMAREMSASDKYVYDVWAVIHSAGEFLICAAQNGRLKYV